MGADLQRKKKIFKGPVEFLGAVSLGPLAGLDFSNVVAVLGAAAVAAAGSGQSTYTALTKQINAVTAADGTKGVALPAAAAGKAIFIVNTVANAVLKVAPVNGGNDAINALTAGTGVFDLGPGQGAWFVPTSATQWYVAAEDGGLATQAEIDRVADVSARLVNLAATSLAISEALHDGKTVKLSHTGAASTVTLPAATGSGARYRFVVGAVNVNNHVIQVTGDDTMKGVVTMLDDDSNAATAYAASGTDDTITLNGTTTGGQIGDWLMFEDIAADVWHVSGALLVPAGSNVADPFSAAV